MRGESERMRRENEGIDVVVKGMKRGESVGLGAGDEVSEGRVEGELEGKIVLGCEFGVVRCGEGR